MPLPASLDNVNFRDEFGNPLRAAQGIGIAFLAVIPLYTIIGLLIWWSVR